MLGRAMDRAKGAPAPASKSTSKSDLAKQLFPSSSPARPESDIQSWVTSKKPQSAAMAPTARVATRPLAVGSGNLRPSSTRNASTMSNANGASQAPNSLVSVCSNAGSFEDLPQSSLYKSQSNASDIMSSVYVNEDDFSDDDTLELDYECPASLPPPRPMNPNDTPEARLPSALATNPTSQMDWSSSPQHHLFPPENTQNLKRSPADNAQQPAKKRILPAHWTPPSKPIDQFDPPDPVDNSAGPFWDATASTVQEWSKQLKNQNKTSQPLLSRDDMQNVLEEHAMPKKAISLSSEQLHVVDLVVNKGRSVFFTGPAGTGKSVLMRTIITELKKKWAANRERLSITASTGLAACNIGGQTLHSFAGIGLGKDDVPTLVKKIRMNRKAKDRWLKTSALIIDEISMVDANLFDKLAQIARTIRNNGRPFGGIQLIVTGDFFQLPPVPEGGRDAKFAFDAATWTTSIDHTIGLTQIFRQRDPDFAGMLNEMRLGKISESTVKAFKGLARPLVFKDGLEVTQLYSTRQEVERSNDMRLHNLPGQSRRFDAKDMGDPATRDRLLSNMMAPKSIVLKEDAQVMLIKNLDDTLVNGSLGKIVGFMAEGVFEQMAGNDPEANTKEAKQKPFNPVEYPVVRFTAIDGTHRIVLCVPEDWKVELPTGEIQASRTQVPLILAWALSIHKAQGQTLERVKVDLGKVFEKGQAYVALSRAVTKEGLQVLGFEKNKVMAHDRVIQFYNKLYSAEAATKAAKKSNAPAAAAGNGSSRHKAGFGGW